MGKPWANLAGEVMAGLVGGVFCLVGALDLAGAGVIASLLVARLTEQTRTELDAVLVVSGFMAAVLGLRSVRNLAARVMPIDPASPVHTLALALAVVFLGGSAAIVAFTDPLSADLSQPPLAPADLILSELPFLILALAGVGFLQRRSPADSSLRLGLVRPRWWHLALALAAAGVFVVVSQLVEGAGASLTPTLNDRLNKASQHVFGGLVATPYGIALIAVVPAVCEDILFRGALQPRFGLVATAVLFAATHMEYGLSAGTIDVFILALGLGYVRAYANTTTSVLTHLAYNLLVGIGITGVAVWPAVAVELLLVGAAAWGAWSSHHKRAPAAEAP